MKCVSSCRLKGTVGIVDLTFVFRSFRTPSSSRTGDRSKLLEYSPNKLQLSSSDSVSLVLFGDFEGVTGAFSCRCSSSANWDACEGLNCRCDVIRSISTIVGNCRYLKMGNGRKKDLRSLSISYNESRENLKNNKIAGQVRKLDRLRIHFGKA